MWRGPFLTKPPCQHTRHAFTGNRGKTACKKKYPFRLKTRRMGDPSQILSKPVSIRIQKPYQKVSVKTSYTARKNVPQHSYREKQTEKQLKWKTVKQFPISQKFQALVKRDASVSTQRRPGSLSRTSPNRQKMGTIQTSINKQTSHSGSRQWESTLSYKTGTEVPRTKAMSLLNSTRLNHRLLHHCGDLDHC